MTSSPPHVLVIEHTDSCPPGLVGQWFAEAGLRLDRVRGHRGDVLPDDLSGHDALLVMGGEMGADDDADHAWLTPTKALLRTAVATGVPTLGVCLGHQLLAVACGGGIEKLPSGPQVGLFPVGRTAAGRRDALFGDLPDGARAVHWNGDIVTTPPADAEVLAASAVGIQALRVGDRAWGVQFHPEVVAADVGPWGRNDIAAGRLDADRFAAAVAEIESAEAELVDHLGALIRRFVALVG